MEYIDTVIYHRESLEFRGSKAPLEGDLVERNEQLKDFLAYSFGLLRGKVLELQFANIEELFQRFYDEFHAFFWNLLALFSVSEDFFVVLNKLLSNKSFKVFDFFRERYSDHPVYTSFYEEIVVERTSLVELHEKEDH